MHLKTNKNVRHTLSKNEAETERKKEGENKFLHRSLFCKKNFRKNNSYSFSFSHQTVFTVTQNAVTVGQMTLDKMTIQQILIGKIILAKNDHWQNDTWQNNWSNYL